MPVSKLFRAYGLYNSDEAVEIVLKTMFQSSFELTGYITYNHEYERMVKTGFKALSSLRVI